MISQAAETATAPKLTKSPTILSQQQQQISPTLQQAPHSISLSDTKSTKHHNLSNSKHNHHNPSKSTPPASNLLHNASTINNVKLQKSASVKKRKRFEETILDGFSIIAFKTWEDLQDELNERSSSLNATAVPATAKVVADSASGNSYDHNVVKKASSKNRHKSSSSSTTSTNLDANSVTNSNVASTTTTSVATTTTTGTIQQHHKDGIRKKKKEKIRRSPSHTPEDNPKEKRNKTSSDKTTLKKALEAKELAEKRLSILQKKLELEQSKNRSGHIDSNDQDQNNQNTTSIVPEHYPSTHTPPEHMRKDEMMINTSNLNCNNSNGHNQIKEQLSFLNVPKPAPYSPFHINSHLQRTKTIIQQPIHSSPPMHHSSSATHNMNQNHHSQQKQQHLPTSNLLQLPNQHPRTTPPPQSVIREPYHPTTPPISSQSESYQPPLINSQSHPATHHMMPPQQHNPLHNPYSSQPSSSIMSSMGFGPLASPYSCPSICITDTISRQTSIIPPIGAALEQSTSQTSTRYGHHHGMLHHPAAHMNAPGHQMFYPIPQTPTERSFMEFVRSYPAPNHHMNYPSLMNSFIPPSSLQAGPAVHAPAAPNPLQVPPSAPLTVPPSFTASAYGFDRSWPRLALDNQRAVNRYNSLYQATNPSPERPYASYAGGRPPPFHAGLFQPPY